MGVFHTLSAYFPTAARVRRFALSLGACVVAYAIARTAQPLFFSFGFIVFGLAAIGLLRTTRLIGPIPSPPSFGGERGQIGLRMVSFLKVHFLALTIIILLAALFLPWMHYQFPFKNGAETLFFSLSQEDTIGIIVRTFLQSWLFAFSLIFLLRSPLQILQNKSPFFGKSNIVGRSYWLLIHLVICTTAFELARNLMLTQDIPLGNFPQHHVGIVFLAIFSTRLLWKWRKKATLLAKKWGQLSLVIAFQWGVLSCACLLAYALLKVLPREQVLSFSQPFPQIVLSSLSLEKVSLFYMMGLSVLFASPIAHYVHQLTRGLSLKGLLLMGLCPLLILLFITPFFASLNLYSPFWQPLFFTVPVTVENAIHHWSRVEHLSWMAPLLLLGGTYFMQRELLVERNSAPLFARCYAKTTSALLAVMMGGLCAGFYFYSLFMSVFLVGIGGSLLWRVGRSSLLPFVGAPFMGTQEGQALSSPEGKNLLL